MTTEPDPTPDHILDCWLEDTVPFIPYYLDDPYGSGGNSGGYPFWSYGQEDTDQHNINPAARAASPTATTTTTAAAAVSAITTPAEPYGSSNSLSSDSSKKRKASHEVKPSQNQKPKKNHNGTMTEAENHGDSVVEGTTAAKKTSGNKKGGSKANGNNHNNGNNKEGRWAEQLLNPCAAAINAGNLNRVQHLLYVLHELASPTGDANHRLAAHGLRALTRHLSSSTSSSAAAISGGPTAFASADPQFFQRSLLKFYEVSPWFSFPINIANSSILQILAEESNSSRTLHIVDIGVSHGVQWPTFLEALTRRPGGPPPRVRLTVVAASENDQNLKTPFSVGPPGDFYSSRLLAFAKTMNINLQIRRVDNQPLPKLDAQIIDTSPDENLIVCAQFRLHNLNHNIPDERTEFLSALRKMEPKGLIICENNMECSCNTCGNFTVGFSRSVDFLWKFLDSTSSAFKGRESEERRLMEGEAAKALINQGEMNEGKEKWCERMKEAGFVGEVLGEDAIDGARALLRKYDNNWEMRVEAKNASVELWWKGQPVSFCSLWKLDGNENEGSGPTLRARI